ncbi:hypothetical protein OQ477_05970 [Bacillus sp. ChL18]|uniref:hypothetical protein n=1 Tax=Bacillus TaxID=1386 RepID=UPI002248F466|nr:hypothetical protein [Bacillus sp. ChL18]MCX2809540.1 hypothetical protein [Bacillus sp. ChL18]
MYLNDMETLHIDAKGRSVVAEIEKKNFIICFVKQENIRSNEEFYEEYVKLLLD